MRAQPMGIETAAYDAERRQSEQQHLPGPCPDTPELVAALTAEIAPWTHHGDRLAEDLPPVPTPGTHVPIPTRSGVLAPHTPVCDEQAHYPRADLEGEGKGDGGRPLSPRNSPPGNPR